MTFMEVHILASIFMDFQRNFTEVHGISCVFKDCHGLHGISRISWARKTIKNEDFPSPETTQNDVHFGDPLRTVGDPRKVWFLYVFQGGRDINLNRLGTGSALNEKNTRSMWKNIRNM